LGKGYLLCSLNRKIENRTEYLILLEKGQIEYF